MIFPGWDSILIFIIEGRRKEGVFLTQLYAIVTSATASGLWAAGAALAGTLLAGFALLSLLSPSRRGQAVGRGVMVLLLLLLPGLFLWKEDARKSLRISEVFSRGENAGGDYVELYNPAPVAMDLTGFRLSDGSAGQGKPLSGTVSPGGYLVITLDPDQDPFSLRREGETVSLFCENSLIDSVTLPALEEGTVYARHDEDGWQIQTPSPGQPNDSSHRLNLPPVFSAPAGFYDDAFSLTLTAQPHCEIYYTLDGSLPDENAARYTSPIPIYDRSGEPNVYRDIRNIVPDWDSRPEATDPVAKATVVRAVSIDPAGSASEVVTQTYFIGQARYKERDVLSMVCQPEDLFGYDGIYVTGWDYDAWYTGGEEGDPPEPNFEKKGRDYEIETHLELFYQGDPVLSQKAGARIQGDSNRTSDRKRFSFFARKEYDGSKYFDLDIFGRRAHSLFTRREYSDVITQELVKDLGIGGLEGRKVSVFLNGEYWYSPYLREKYHESYLAQRYLVEEDRVQILDAVPQELYDLLDTLDLSTDAGYDALNEAMDIDNYITFLCANIYLCNMDSAEHKNLKLWRTVDSTGQGMDDGRWRFLVYDMDCLDWNNGDGFYGIESYGINSFSATRRFMGGSHNEEPLYRALYQNERFRRQFALTFMDLCNTCFTRENALAHLSQEGEDLSWCDRFFDLRPDYIIPYMAEEFALSGQRQTLSLHCDPERGGIRVNSVRPDISEGIWEGEYYDDYPVTLTAEPKPGWEFTGWRHEGAFIMENQITVPLTGGENRWTAEFKPLGEANG